MNYQAPQTCCKGCNRHRQTDDEPSEIDETCSSWIRKTHNYLYAFLKSALQSCICGDGVLRVEPIGEKKAQVRCEVIDVHPPTAVIPQTVGGISRSSRARKRIKPLQHTTHRAWFAFRSTVTNRRPFCGGYSNRSHGICLMHNRRRNECVLTIYVLTMM